jgi:DNA polymerase I
MGYGAGAGLIGKKLKISKAAAEAVWEGYHDLYHEIDEYNAKEVAFAKEHGYVVSDISGLRLLVPDINSNDSASRSKTERLIGNFKIQSSSILTVRAMVKFQQWIEENNLMNKVKLINTIYDAIYMEIDTDVEIVRQCNEKIVEYMTAPYKPNMQIPLEAALDIGVNWKEMTTIPNNASLATIEEILKSI